MIRSDQYQQDLIIETKTNITPTETVSEILINSVGEEIPSKTAKEPSTAHTASSTLKPTREELRCAIDKIYQLPITPVLNVTGAVEAMLVKHWSNVESAIAYTREAARTWKKPARSWEGVLVDALKTGKQPSQNRHKSIDISEPPAKLVQWFESNRDKAKDLYFSSLDNAWMVVLKNGFTRLGINQIEALK